MILLVILAGIVFLGLIGLLIWYLFFRTPEQGGLIRLPLERLGLKDIPGVPFSIEATLDAALLLRGRSKETNQAVNGLQRIYTIQGRTANARSFLFDQTPEDHYASAHDDVRQELERSSTERYRSATLLRPRLAHDAMAETPSADGLTSRFLTDPRDFSISWTDWAGVYRAAEKHLAEYSKTLEVSNEGAAAATAAFWPQIAEGGMGFNLLLPKKLGVAEPDHRHAGKTLYRIDLRLFENFPATVVGFIRFTPGTVIELYQDPESLNLLPYRIDVFGHGGSPHQTYIAGEATNGMWLYALQAAKAGVTVWGIWMGHVHQWHLVTTALQLTLFTTPELTPDHPVRRLLDPMSNYVIGFDGFLLFEFEKLAPPTSFRSALDFLDFQNFVARGRDFHDDDPIPTLQRLGIDAEDFTQGPAWNRYPIVGHLLDLWHATEKYVTTYVHQTWTTNEEVIHDVPLRAWVRASGAADGGNLSGLPALDGPRARDELIRLLTSYLYRVTAHGSSRVNSAANPRLSFVANFPPCLQSDEIYPPEHPLTTKELLRFLPNTGTIGSMLRFLDIFVFSAPYASFVPAEGIDQDLFFPGGPDAPLNHALIEFRLEVEKVVRATNPASPQIHQWPRNIET